MLSLIFCGSIVAAVDGLKCYQCAVTLNHEGQVVGGDGECGRRQENDNYLAECFDGSEFCVVEMSVDWNLYGEQERVQ